MTIAVRNVQIQIAYIAKQPHSCYECSSSFTLYEKQCGLSECDHIKHCFLCNQNECIKCKSICILSNGECKCTERIVIIIVCIILSILVVGLVIYCLTKLKE